MITGEWVFIMTNSRSYNDVRASERVYLLDENTPVLNYEFDEVYPIDFLNPGVYIVFDNYPGFFQLCDNLGSKRKIFILTHTNCQLDYKTLSKHGFGSVKEGMHERRENNGRFYPDVIEILESAKSVDEIYEGVWNAVFAGQPLEEKLRVLHMCLSPTGVKEVISKKLHEKIGLNEGLFKKLSHFSDPFSDAYLAKLTEIRDKVFGDNFE